MMSVYQFLIIENKIEKKIMKNGITCSVVTCNKEITIHGIVIRYGIVVCKKTPKR